MAKTNFDLPFDNNQRQMLFRIWSLAPLAGCMLVVAQTANSTASMLEPIIYPNGTSPHSIKPAKRI